MHFLYSLLYMALASLFFSKDKKFTLSYIITMIIIAIVSNIPLLNSLSLNDFAYSVLGAFSLLSVLILILVIFKKEQILSTKAFGFIFITHLVFFLCALNIISLNIYYASKDIVVGIACALCIFGYLFNKALGYMYFASLCVFIVFGSNIFDGFFDAFGLFVSFFICVWSFFKTIFKALSNKRLMTKEK